MGTHPDSVVPTDHVKDVQGVFLDYIMSGVFPTNTLIDVAMEMRYRQQTDDVTEVISTRKDLRSKNEFMIVLVVFVLSSSYSPQSA